MLQPLAWHCANVLEEAWQDQRRNKIARFELVEKRKKKLKGKPRCTYPGPSVVMMGFSPSFFRFLLMLEFPFVAVAPIVMAGFCAAASLVCCEPFIVQNERKI